MRFDKDGKMKTLEDDIENAFKMHGLTVIEEKFEKDTWIIKAVRK